AGKRDAMAGKQRLVGRDHMLARGERRTDAVFSRPAVTADQFDEHVDLGRHRQGDGIVEPRHCGKIDAAVTAAVACTHTDDRDGPTTTRRELVRLPRHEVKQRRSDRTEAGHAQTQVIHHKTTRSVSWKLSLEGHRDAPMGTTLCNVSSAVSRKRRMPRAACRMRCSFSTKPMRM